MKFSNPQVQAEADRLSKSITTLSSLILNSKDNEYLKKALVRRFTKQEAKLKELIEANQNTKNTLPTLSDSNFVDKDIQKEFDAIKKAVNDFIAAIEISKDLRTIQMFEEMVYQLVMTGRSLQAEYVQVSNF